ncbi:hypothetical protein C8Q74DRAFT_1435287 [Fomes fomentarius]|nr:hypothetical protein C8Q74DRAFT_1435287 [Fomes fomentarius]
MKTVPKKASVRGSRAGSSQQPTASSSSPAPPQQRVQSPQTPAQASSSKDGVKTRQKRVLPTRSRRGGPGVGSCETDVMILETLKRKLESEPLIPATTQFLLTTNSALIPPPAAPASEAAHDPETRLNTMAYGRYFERPEVRKAYKEQLLIQTPEFAELPQDAHVGGRFRPRGSEDESVDTSDAAYEKRHRKYETFEKRQRLREKEKLKHEHYKLKERIDQLRAMDTSAFLAIPASEFEEPSAPGPSVQPDNSVDTFNLHGAAAYHEGERRRKEMLEVALSLEQRYRTLLPPDRRWMEKKSDKSPSKRASIDAMAVEEEDGEEEVEPGEEVEEQAEEEVEDEATEEESGDEVEVVEEEPGKEPADDGESEVDPEEIEQRKSKKLKLRIKFPPRMFSSKQESKPPPSRGGGKQITLSPFFKHSGGGKGPLTSSPLRSRSYAGPDTTKYGRYSAESETLPQAPSTKRQRVDTSASASARSKSSKVSKSTNGVNTSDSVSSTGHSSKKEPTPCVLMIAALRQSSAPTARKTQRHVTAFGTRVPPELEEVRDFEVPEWVLATGSASEDGDREGSYEYPHSHGGYSASVTESDPGT